MYTVCAHYCSLLYSLLELQEHTAIGYYLLPTVRSPAQILNSALLATVQTQRAAQAYKVGYFASLTAWRLKENVYVLYIEIYMVQYAEIQHFYQKSGKNENFYLPVIFKVIRVMSSYISQTVHRTIKVVTSISSIPADF